MSAPTETPIGQCDARHPRTGAWCQRPPHEGTLHVRPGGGTWHSEAPVPATLPPTAPGAVTEADVRRALCAFYELAPSGAEWLPGLVRCMRAALAADRAARRLTAERERDAWRAYALHCERVLADLRAVASDLYVAWDTDQESRVGKLATALDGALPGYDKRIDAFRYVFEARPATEVDRG